MKVFENYMKHFDTSALLGMKAMYGGSVTRAEFREMVRAYHTES